MNAASPAPTPAPDPRWRPLRTLRFAIVVALIFALLAFALTSKSPAWSTDLGWWHAGSTSLVFALCIVGAVLALAQVQTLQRRWSRHNAELPLLALLPGLGDTVRIKRELLLANLLPTLGVQALLILAMLGLAASLHLDAGSGIMLLLGQLTGMGMLTTLALVTLGGVHVRDGWLMVLCTCGYLLVNISVVLALPMVDNQPFIHQPAVAWAAAIAWAGLFVPLLRLGVLGWHGLRNRPHPFLPVA